MASKFLPLDCPKKWGMLNAHLGAESYVGGFTLNQDDVAVYKALKGQMLNERWIHISRWYSHFTRLMDLGMISALFQKTEKSTQELDQDLDLFGEQTEAEKVEAERCQNAASASKPAPTSVSAIIFDIKPWGEEIDMAELEAEVRKVKLPSLEWKASELVPIVGKIHTLRILCHFTDDLFTVEEDLKAALENLEEYVQSVDIFAWNKR